MQKVYTYMNSYFVDPNFNKKYTHAYSFDVIDNQLIIMLSTILNNAPINVPVRVTKESLNVIISNLRLKNIISNEDEIKYIAESFPYVEPKYIPSLFDLSVTYVNQTPLVLVMN